MRRKRFGSIGSGVIALIIVALAASTGQAFTASNTSQASRGGEGSATISGYEVSNVQYALNGSDPTKIAAVSFTINPITAGQVKVRLVSDASTWYACANAGGSVTCATTFPQATLATAGALTVVATQ